MTGSSDDDKGEECGDDEEGDEDGDGRDDEQGRAGPLDSG